MRLVKGKFQWSKNKISFKGVSLYFSAFCLNLLDFKTENNFQFTHAVLIDWQNDNLSVVKGKQHENCIFVNAFKPIFRVQRPGLLLIHNSIKTMDLHAGPIINNTSLWHFINYRRYHEIFFKNIWCNSTILSLSCIIKIINKEQW